MCAKYTLTYGINKLMHNKIPCSMSGDKSIFELKNIKLKIYMFALKNRVTGFRFNYDGIKY